MKLRLMRYAVAIAAVLVMTNGCASQRGLEDVRAQLRDVQDQVGRQGVRIDNQSARLEQLESARTTTVASSGGKSQQVKVTAQASIEGAFKGGKLTANGRAVVERLAGQLAANDAEGIVIYGFAPKCPAVGKNATAKAKAAFARCERTHADAATDRADAVGGLLQETEPELTGLQYGRKPGRAEDVVIRWRAVPPEPERVARVR